MRIIYILTMIMSICALRSGAQTLTATYMEYADSADRYIRQERWEDAERVIVKALRHEPGNKSNYLLWSNLAIVRTNIGNHDGALEACEIGLASAPRSTALISNRARAYLAKGDIDNAVRDLDHALELDSTLQWPRKMRGLIRASRGDTPGASTDFDVYTARFGTDAAVNEARADLAASGGDFDAALPLYREAYRIEPEARLLEKMLVEAYFFGRLDELNDELADGIKTYPRDGNLYLIRAMLNRTRYQTEAMESDLKIAKKLGADDTLYNQLTLTHDTDAATSVKQKK